MEIINGWLEELRNRSNVAENRQIPKEEIEKELEEVKGSLSNERVWRTACSGFEARMHTENITRLISYQDALEGLLGKGIATFCADDFSFEEKWEDDGRITFYFTAPKEALNCFFAPEKYPKAQGMTLSLEVPADAVCSEYASVEVSPYKELLGMVSDYDWNDVSLPSDQIDTLLAKALETGNRRPRSRKKAV